MKGAIMNNIVLSEVTKMCAVIDEIEMQYDTLIDRRIELQRNNDDLSDADHGQLILLEKLMKLYG